MLGLAYIKFPPTTYVLHYRNGQVIREGPGQSFLYFAPTSTVVAIPLASRDLPFVFREISADFQEVTLQGQLTYRLTDPKKLSSLLNFSVDARGQYVSEDPAQLDQRLIKSVQVQARASLKLLGLRQILSGVDEITRDVWRGLAEREPMLAQGIEVLALNFTSISPTPEMARALEAETREQLNRQADEAIYARRKASVEQERMIRESELATELAVEARQREIREAKMAADIAMEEQRAILIAQTVSNERQEAESRAYALSTIMAPVRDLDWRTLMALSHGGDSGMFIAGAFQELAGNASKIGELNLSSELLQGLLRKK